MQAHASPAVDAAARRPRLLLLLSDLGCGGAERQTVQLARLLADRYDIVVGTLKAGAGGADDGPVAAALERERARLAEVVCFDVRRRVDRAALGRLAATIERHGIELVLCANTFPLLYAQLARLRVRRRLRVVEVYHTTLVARASARLKLLAFRPLFWLCDQLVFVCEGQRRHCMPRLLWAPRTAVVHNGVDVRHFDPARLPAPEALRARFGLAADDRVVGLCAVFRPEKAHADLLEAVARLAARGVAWKVLLIGDGPTRPRIEAAIVRLGLRDAVRITGFLDDVREAVVACDVMALVSTSIETFSLAALEAMALGKPMVMSRIGGAEEQVEAGVTGELFAPGDAGALAGCLDRLADRDRCRALGEAARRKVVREFSEEAMAEGYRAVIDRLLGRPRRPGREAPARLRPR